MNELMKKVIDFRSKMDCASREGLFSNDIIFSHFPKGCCGDTCYLLAEYLKQHGIQTIYVCGTFHEQSHAWLVVKDNSIHIPAPKYYTMPNETKKLLEELFGEAIPNEPIDISKYEESDLAKGILIDITADQFGQGSIYVGPLDHFHRKFDFDFAHDYDGLEDGRLFRLYDKILRY